MQLDITEDQARTAATALRRAALRLEVTHESDGLFQNAYTSSEVAEHRLRAENLRDVAEKLTQAKDRDDG